MSLVQILVGPIASGKSTFAACQAEKGAVIINDDALVIALSGGKYLWKSAFKPIYKTLENNILESAILRNLPAVVDRPNHSRNNRMRFITLAKTLDCRVEVVVFPREGPEIHARRRAESDGRGFGYEYWLKVAQHHETLYEEPDMSEGMDSIVPYK